MRTNNSSREVLSRSAHQHVNGGRKQDNGRQTFFQSQVESIATAERDVVGDANRVHQFDDHRSIVLPWL